MHSDTADSLFSNSITYDAPTRPFVDRYSQFGVVFPAGRPFGPGQLQVRSSVLHQDAADALLTLWLHDSGRLVPLRRGALVSLPWETRERGEVHVAPEAEPTTVVRLVVTARHVFLDESRLLSSFTICSDGDSIDLEPVFLGQIAPERRADPSPVGIYGYSDVPARTMFATADDNSVTGGLLSPDEPQLPSHAFCITQVNGPALTPAVSSEPPWMDNTAGTRPAVAATRAGTPEGAAAGDAGGWANGEPPFYRFGGELKKLADGDSIEFAFVTELSVATYRHGNFDWRGPGDKHDVEEAAAGARTAFLERIDAARAPAVARTTAVAEAWKARFALSRTGFQASGPAGEFGSLVASTCVPSSAGFTRAFFWDAIFSSAAAARFAPQLAKGAILAQFVRQTEEGYCPEHGFNYHVPGRNVIGAPQAPVASWSVDKYLRANPDDLAFLETIYPKLVRNHAYWEKLSDRDRDGLAEWTWSGQTADNSPLWDELKPARMMGGCTWLPPIASVQLNCFLYRDATTLAAFSERRNDAEAAKHYRNRAAAIQEALMRVCYVPADRRFWDYNHATGRHTRVKTFYLFWPIWAGLNLDAALKRELIEKVLLDPKQFFGAVPFPSVAYDEASYDPVGYWRGRAWPQISYWLLEMLAEQGYHDAADEAARRLIAAYDREASFPENLATDPCLYDSAGVPDYNWGCAAYYLIATGAYRES